MLDAAEVSLLPSIKEQAVYTAAGALAGAAIFPIELGSMLSSPTRIPTSTLFRSHASIQVPRVALRFWTFDIVKSLLSGSASEPPPPARTALVGAVGGFSGGLTEVTYQALVFDRRLPTLRALAPHSSRLFFCFGTYNFLAASLSNETPPRPFWYCWLMGSTAGATGSAIIAAVSGLRGKGFLAATGKGALVIGTVISVQVTSCAEALRRTGS